MSAKAHCYESKKIMGKQREEGGKKVGGRGKGKKRGFSNIHREKKGKEK